MNLLVDISTNLSSCISFSIFCKKTNSRLSLYNKADDP